MKHHPAADAFPMMADDRFRELTEDIAKNGQRVPVGEYVSAYHHDAEEAD